MRRLHLPQIRPWPLIKKRFEGAMSTLVLVLPALAAIADLFLLWALTDCWTHSKRWPRPPGPCHDCRSGNHGLCPGGDGHRLCTGARPWDVSAQVPAMAGYRPISPPWSCCAHRLIPRGRCLGHPPGMTGVYVGIHIWIASPLGRAFLDGADRDPRPYRLRLWGW